MVACPACRTPNSEFNAFCRVCSMVLTAGDRSTGSEASPHTGGGIPKGTVVSHYEVQDLIGAGAMGQVYRAFDGALGRPVALKFLSSGLADDRRARERMRREAQAASALDHPGIATIFEVSEHEGRPFISMMLYEGETLAAALQRGPLSIREAARIGTELASALAAAHSAGIVHRDVKPANVMLTRSGAVKLVDFGLAKIEAGAEATMLTRTGSILGTVAYMAPEQLAGEAIDHRADLWSLGVLLYEAISGRLPIAGEGLAHRILTKDPVPLASARADVPRPVARLVMRLLKKAPAMRVQSAAEVERSLREWSEGRASGESALLSGSRPKIVAGAALAALAVAGMLAFVRPGSEPAREPFAAARAEVRDIPGDKLDLGVHVTTVRPSSLFAPSTNGATLAPAAIPADPPTRGVVANPTAGAVAKRPARESESTVAARSAAPGSTVVAPAASGAGTPSARASFDGLGLPEKPF